MQRNQQPQPVLEQKGPTQLKKLTSNIPEHPTDIQSECPIPPVLEQTEPEPNHDPHHQSTETQSSVETPKQSAKERALNLPEILNDILANCDPGTIRSTKRVSKFWRAETKTRRIRRAAIHRPRKITAPFEMYLHLRTDSPWYESPWIFGLHPALAFQHDYRDKRTLSIDLGHEHHPRMKRYSEEFVTLPPSCAVGLRICPSSGSTWPGTGYPACTVYRPEGVRIGDLLDTGEIFKERFNERDGRTLVARITSRSGFVLPADKKITDDGEGRVVKQGYAWQFVD